MQNRSCWSVSPWGLSLAIVVVYLFVYLVILLDVGTRVAFLLRPCNNVHTGLTNCPYR